MITESCWQEARTETVLGWKLTSELRGYTKSQKIAKLFSKNFSKTFCNNYIGCWENVLLKSKLIRFKSDVWRILGVDRRVVTWIEKGKLITQ